FAGHALARAHGTVTYAEYLHAGFAQLLVAAALAVLTVGVGHRLVGARGPDVVKAPSSKAGVWLGAIETTLLALTCVTLLSCWQRVRIYEVAYRYTYLRRALGFLLLRV